MTFVIIWHWFFDINSYTLEILFELRFAHRVVGQERMSPSVSAIIDSRLKFSSGSLKIYVMLFVWKLDVSPVPSTRISTLEPVPADLWIWFWDSLCLSDRLWDCVTPSILLIVVLFAMPLNRDHSKSSDGSSNPL